VAQRGTSFSGNGYTLDRFNAGNNPTDISQNTSDVPSGFQYSMNLTGSNHLLNYRMESKDSFRLSGKTATLSFYAKNISGTNTLKAQIGHPSATDNFAIQTVLENSSNITLTSSWARYEITFSALSSNIEKGLFFYIVRNGSTATDQTRITGVQLEVGDTATPFEHRSYGEELALCQRYYWQIGDGVSSDIVGIGGNFGTVWAYFSGTFPVRMRTTPTTSVNNDTYFRCHNTSGSGINTDDFDAPSEISNTQYYISFSGVSSFTAGSSNLCFTSNTGGDKGIIKFDAEL